MFGRWVVWVALGWLCLVDGWHWAGFGWVGSKSHCRAVPAVPSPIWCASILIFIDDVSFKL